MAKIEWFDITLPLNNEIPIPPPMPQQPGQAPPSELSIPLATVYRFFDVDKGDKVTMSRIEMTSHDGTHIDSPLHFIPGGTTIDAMPIETTIGPCRVIQIKDETSVTVKELKPYKIRAGERILFKTKNSPNVWAVRQYTGKSVTVSLEAARYLAEKRIRLVGIDYISIASAEPMENVNDVHKTFLSNGIFILEALNLTGIKPGKYDLFCLPLRLEKGDAGPCRAILRKKK
ncbi:MAG: cyclase family protein [Acidobacteria bacterium]|nr:cyclase family protein [Acidobacteriota bacterium]